MRAPARLRAAARILLLALATSSLWLATVVPAQELPPRCGGLHHPDRRGRFVARADLLRRESVVDGDDLLALVNRTPGGALPHDYAPRDLVDLATMRPARAWQCVPPRKQCLREEAARAYRRLERAMRDAGLRPYPSSAFRGYEVQCSTFLGWAERERGGRCAAATASALPGHSQHQLGTALDLFTREWNDGGNRFRAGYACSAGGRFLAAHAHEHGFVIAYPLHPDYRRPGSDCAAIEGAEERIDPRTGYRYEPWHLRFIGVENAARFHRAWEESGPGTPGEITLEQWLRSEHGSDQGVYAPVCDGCNCDRCATFSSPEDAPCEHPPLVLAADGTPSAAEAPPSLLDATLAREGERVVLHARVRVPPNTLTQPPVVTPASLGVFRRGSREPRFPTQAPRAFAPLEGAWRLAIGFGEHEGYWPWRAALAAAARDGTANGLNARMPAPPGELELTIAMEAVLPGTLVRVGIASGDEVRDVRRMAAP